MEKHLIITHLKPLAAPASRLRPYQNHKFDFHSTKCVFLGYSPHHKGFQRLSSIGRLYVSRHVIFNEEEFPFIMASLTSNYRVPTSLDTYTSEQHLQTLSHQLPSAEQSSNGGESSGESLSAATPQGEPKQLLAQESLNYETVFDQQEEAENDFSLGPPSFQELRGEEADVPCTEVTNQNVTHQMITRAKAGVFKPKQFPQDNYLLQAETKENKLPEIPGTVDSALNHPL